jgi:hypothetical protein
MSNLEPVPAAIAPHLPGLSSARRILKPMYPKLSGGAVQSPVEYALVSGDYLSGLGGPIQHQARQGRD